MRTREQVAETVAAVKMMIDIEPFFASAEEADEYLPFYEGDQDAGAAERLALQESARYQEWERWRAGSCQ